MLRREEPVRTQRGVTCRVCSVPFGMRTGLGPRGRCCWECPFLPGFLPLRPGQPDSLSFLFTEAAPGRATALLRSVGDAETSMHIVCGINPVAGLRWLCLKK